MITHYYSLLLFILLSGSGLFAQQTSRLLKDSCRGLPGERLACRAGDKEIFFSRSTDGGRSWQAEKPIAPFKNGGALGRLSIACDTGNMFRGRIYVCWSDEKNGAKNKDVFLVYSDDAGANWTEPILVSYRPNHKDQFKPAMAVDAASGRLYLCYFDRQNYLDPGLADVYLAVSDNGGLLFTTCKLNRQPIVTSYTAVVQNAIRITGQHQAEVSWSSGQGKNKKSFSQHVNDSLLAALEQEMSSAALQTEKIVAFDDIITLNIATEHDLSVDIAITKPLLPGFEKVVARRKQLPTGRHPLLIHTKQLGLQKGNYIVTLYYGGRNVYIWLLAD